MNNLGFNTLIIIKAQFSKKYEVPIRVQFYQYVLLFCVSSLGM